MTANDRGERTGHFCGHCGEPVGAGRHVECTRRLELEPPRYCGTCRRRLVVQVMPGAWTARCVEHGTFSASTWKQPRS